MVQAESGSTCLFRKFGNPVSRDRETWSQNSTARDMPRIISGASPNDWMKMAASCPMNALVRDYCLSSATQERLGKNMQHMDQE